MPVFLVEVPVGDAGPVREVVSLGDAGLAGEVAPFGAAGVVGEVLPLDDAVLLRGEVLLAALAAGETTVMGGSMLLDKMPRSAAGKVTFTVAVAVMRILVTIELVMLVVLTVVLVLDVAADMQLLEIP